MIDTQHFWSKVIFQPGSCWEWSGSHLSTGYPRFSFNGADGYAHRFAYEIEYGPISEEHQIDHLCRNRGCVNPTHLEAVTPKENITRGICSNREKTTCPQGHHYDRRWGKNKQRACSKCESIQYYKGKS